MNRLLSRREKDGSSHRRDKSRDKKVSEEEIFPLCLPLISVERDLTSNPSVIYPCATFRNPHSKASPSLQITYSVIHGSNADSHSCASTQNRPLSGDGFMALFKPNDQKKASKELKDKVKGLRFYFVYPLIISRYHSLKRSYKKPVILG